MANETVFQSKAADYAAGRPAYALEAVDFILSHLPEGGAVADIGSGTGIFTREFIRRGIRTFAVEPSDTMRAEAERVLGGSVEFHSVAATAEETGLPAGSVALVTAASAFHWFDAERFRGECRRILTPGGAVCLLFHVRTYDEFTWRQHRLCGQYGEGFVSLAHGWEKTQTKLPAFYGGEFEIRAFDFPLTYTEEKFLARSLSSSYAPDPASPKYTAYREALRCLLDEYAVDGTITVANRTVVVCGRIASE